MEISLKNLLLAGIGTISYSYEKAASLVEELVQKGEITVSQGTQINEELKRKMRAGKNCTKPENASTLEMIKEALANMNLATKQDIEELKERLSKLGNS